MKFTGSYKLKAKKEIVWESLNDTNILKRGILRSYKYKKN